MLSDSSGLTAERLVALQRRSGHPIRLTADNLLPFTRSQLELGAGHSGAADRLQIGSKHLMHVSGDEEDPHQSASRDPLSRRRSTADADEYRGEVPCLSGHDGVGDVLNTLAITIAGRHDQLRVIRPRMSNRAAIAQAPITPRWRPLRSSQALNRVTVSCVHSGASR
jgi:hypothetical protein